ncbi:MAG TPA: acyltransferase [Ktedonobacterales bacterium]|nr:acyltransferase [Ktedonobacterales bacterium]
MTTATIRPANAEPAWRRGLRWLRPMDNGPREIRSMDGLRALAALSVVAFHTLLAMRFYQTPLGQAFGTGWYYLAMGVQLFFVLSGFLLFLPYVRAMLHGRPLPSALRFYRRRALRIFPAYWVCLAILVVLPTATHKTSALLPDIAAHVGMVHDMFPVFNQDFEGPFWTLAVEFQFYLLLPLIAAGIARLVNGTRSVWRIVAGVLGMMVLALIVRSLDAAVMARIPSFPGSLRIVAKAGVLLTMGTQGKNLEVFAIGMLCAVLYIITIEERRVSERVTQRLAYVALAITALVLVIAVPQWPKSAVQFAPGAVWGWDIITYPLLIGVGYGALALAALWGNRIVRFPFELAPLRFIGLISYSLYLWHLPFIDILLPGIAGWPLALRIAGAFVTAYLSYQLVERPFLKRRHREAPAARPVAAPAENAVPAGG